MAQPLVNLDTRDYEHPFDRAALEALSKVPMFDKIVNFVLNWTTIKWKVVELCGSSFHVTDRSCPELHNLVREVADTLYIKKLPEIYTQWTYGINAFTTGHKDDAILVVYSGAVDLMSDQELKYIVGHEMGHIKSGHVLYHLMANFINQIIDAMGIVGSFAVPIKTTLDYWDRMSEFTADRAGLLACQDLDAALSATMKMSGLPKKYFNTCNPHIFAEQAQEFLQRYGDTANSIIRNISILNDSHPWTVLRASELIKWVESGEYGLLLEKYKGITCPICGRHLPKDTKICPSCSNTLL